MERGQRLAGEAIAARLRALERPPDALAEGKERLARVRPGERANPNGGGEKKSWPASRIERKRVLPNWAIYF